MFLLDIYRAFRFAWQSFWRNFWLSIVTITIISLALISVSFLLLFNITTTHVIDTVQNNTEIYIDLTPQAKLAQVQFLVDELNKLPEIKAVQFITPEETLQAFKERYSDNSVVMDSLESLDENPFTGSLMLKVQQIDQFSALLDEISKPEYGDILEINNSEFYQARDLINAINDYSQKVENVGFGISIFFVLISIIVVFNTIQMGIYSHREEIGIMKLVGASNSFIRAPFLIEGILYSFIAIILVGAIIYPLSIFVQPHLDNFLGEYSLSLVNAINNSAWQVFGLEIGIAILITVISSLLATRRYLKV
ncbi:MAG: cell division protein FtsX [Candidatus Komeilibacteria bacterium]